MGNITLKQYNGSTVSPKDDAILYDLLTRQQNGIIYGCDITWVGSNQLHIDAGYGIIRGRLFEITEHTIYATIPSIDNVSYYGYVCIAVELENDEAPVRIATFATNSEWNTSDFEQDEEINYINGIWEMPVATYRASSSGITNFESNVPHITKPYLSISSFAELGALTEGGYLVDAMMIKKQILTFTNKNIAVASWVPDTTYAEYPYRASVTCSGVDANYVPNVIFDAMDCNEGIFAPVANSASNAVYIYANAKPSAAITIPTIQCIRKVG